MAREQVGTIVSGQLSDDLLRRRFSELGFVTLSETMMPLLRQANKAACVSDITVLMEGETGTGKQILAYAIHQLDQKRRLFPFVTVHCGTISETLAESELFGHEQGAFSGAIRRRKGLFQTAHQGTLFLDDVNDLPSSLQPKLLDVLQRAALRPLGADRETPVDARVIAASNQPLSSLVQQQRFRSDLYHRLNVVRLTLPPLRERPRDLAALVLIFAYRHRNVYPNITEVEPELVRHLESEPFWGNLRELEHAVQRMLFVKAEGSMLLLSDWRKQAPQSSSESEHELLRTAADAVWRAICNGTVSYGGALRRIDKNVLETALRSGGKTRREVASRLQTSERTLYHKLRSHKIFDEPAP
jgi:transcriptional regulator with GAF, ATPase, and Fis domain